MPQTRSLYLHSLWRNNVSKCWMSKSIFAVEGITLLKDIHFDLFVFVYLCLIWTKSKLINNHWKALEEYFLMSQKGIIYLFSLKKNHTLKYYMSIWRHEQIKIVAYSWPFISMLCIKKFVFDPVKKFVHHTTAPVSPYRKTGLQEPI